METKNKIATVAQLRATFPSLDKRVRKELGLSNSEADTETLDGYIQQTLKFLAKAATSEESLPVPSKEVDAVWHAMVLSTKAYKAWNKVFYGKFIHHTPDADQCHGITGSGDSEATVKAFLESLEEATSETESGGNRGKDCCTDIADDDDDDDNRSKCESEVGCGAETE